MFTECPLGNHGPDCVYKCSATCLGDVACNRKTESVTLAAILVTLENCVKQV